ncbi:MAG: hypothetical protein GXO90_06930 [FCB group bacterium]|nr:hypothetical protein [FCB group bacterium]
MKTQDNTIPKGLKTWFLIHFWVDIAFALPLMIAPGFSMRLFGFPVVEPLATRLVAAALIGIGGASFLNRNAGVESYRSLLNLKLLWSSAASVGILWSILERYVVLWFGWFILAVFVGFFFIWLNFRMKLPPAQQD